MVSDTDRNPRHHVDITKSGTTVSFNLCDAYGKYDPTAILQSLQPRISIKMHQGGTKHSSYEPPYASLEQRDFSGGRGLDDHDLDPTRYYDGKYVDTWGANRLILGPQFTYGTGYRSDINQNAWGNNYTWTSLYTSTRYIAVPFTVPATGYTTSTISIPVRSTGTTTQATYAIYSESGGEPDASVKSGTVSLTDNAAQFLTISLAQAVTAATDYFLVVDGGSGADADNHLQVCVDDDEATGFTSADASTWAAADAMYFRISGKTTPEFKPYFVMHQGIPHVVLDYDDNSAPKVYINGDYGHVTSSTGTTLTDSGASWTVDEWIGATVVLTSGKGSEAIRRYFTITDNDGTSVTVAGWDVTPDESTMYAIIDTNIWKEITGHGMTSGPITDVLSHSQMLYIARGDLDTVVSARFPLCATGEWDDEVGTYGTYLQGAKDSAGHMRIWKATREPNAKLDKSFAPWANYWSQLGELDWSFDVSLANGDMEADSSWSAVGTPTTEEQSSEQAHNGTYSWKLVCDAADEGITQTITVSDATHYSVRAKIYIVSGSANGVSIQMGGVELDSLTTGKVDQWLHLEGFRKTTSTSENIQVLSKNGAAEFYVDDVDIYEHPTYLSVTGVDGRVSNLIRYGEPERVWVLTENGLYMEDNGDLLPIPIQELANVGDYRNGLAACVHDVYLYFSFLDGVERYYKSNLDDVGPNRDEGMPSARRGNIVEMVTYPGRIYAALDGGADNTSCILLYNELGWHEVYRAPAAGLRVQGLLIQALPGEDVDKLWFGCGRDLLWIPVDLNPRKNSDYNFMYEGYIESQSIYYGKKDIEKFFKELRLVTENLSDTSGNTRTILVDYKVDGATSWTEIGTYDSSEFETQDISSTYDVTGRRFQWRLRIRTEDPTETPQVRAVVLDFIEQVPVKESYTMTFIAEDDNVTLQGVPSNDRVQTGMAQLQTWLDEPDPATIASMSDMIDGKWVKIYSLTYKPLILDAESQKEKLLCTMTLIEV